MRSMLISSQEKFWTGKGVQIGILFLMFSQLANTTSSNMCANFTI